MFEGSILAKKFPVENLVIFAFKGDFTDASYLLQTINPAINEYRNIVLDVSKIDYINSSAFGAIFELASKIEDNKTNISFLNPNKKFKIIFESLGASRIFKVITSLNEL